MKYHVCIKIETGMEMLGKGKNIFDSTPLDAFQALVDAKEAGKTYYTGCDSTKTDGSCAGHSDEAERRLDENTK